MHWPFKDMVEGEVRVLYDVVPGAAAIAAHNYGRTKGWRFKTRKCVEADGRVGLVVKRLAGGDGKPTTMRRTIYGLENLKVGESAVFTDPDVCRKLTDNIYARGRALGMKFSREAEYDWKSHKYTKLTIWRVR